MDFRTANQASGDMDSRAASEVLALFEDLASPDRTLLFPTRDQGLSTRAKRALQLLDRRVRHDRVNH